MKTLSILLLVILLSFILVPHVMAAQDNPPANPQSLVDATVAVIVALATLAGSILNNLVTGLPWLNDEDKGLVKSAITQLLTVIVSLATGYVSYLVATGLGFVQDVGVQSVLVTALTAVFVELRYRLVKLQPA